MTYPCPYCGGPASIRRGCPRCGAGPDPEAAEVVALDQALPQLHAHAARAGATLHRATADLHRATEDVRRATEAAEAAHTALTDAQRRRAALAAAVTARAAAHPTVLPAAPTSAAPTSAGPAPAHVPGLFPAGGIPVDVFLQHAPPPDASRPGREASGRTLQTVLFVLGGVLLGSAAIAFTAVAWATYGVPVRAAILAAVTVLVLAVPPVALRRGLRGTAETFAAVGTLLLLLDGYAARATGLAGLDALPAAPYAAALCAGTAAAGWGYARAVGVAAPRYGALLVGQAVPLTLAGSAYDRVDLVVLACGAQALGDTLVARRASAVGLRVVARLAGAAAVALGLLWGMVTLATVDGVAAGAGAAAGTLAVLAVGLYGAYESRQPFPRDLADVAVGVLAALPVLLFAARAFPPLGAHGTPVLALLCAGGYVAARHRSSARAARSLYRVAAAVALAGVSAVLAAALVAGGNVTGRPAGAAPWAWLALPALAAGAAAVLVLLSIGPAAERTRPYRVDALLAALVPAVPLTGAALALPRWGVGLLAAPVAALLVGVAARAPGRAAVLARAALGAGLGAFALVVAVGWPAAQAAAAAALLIGALTLARTAGPDPLRRHVGGAGAAAAVLLAPFALFATLSAAGVPDWWRARAYLVVLAGFVALAAVVARRVPAHRRYVYVPVLLLAALAPMWAGGGATDEPIAVYAGLALIAVAATVRLVNARVGAAAWAGALPLLAWLVGCLPALSAVYLLPYGWLLAVWDGRPGGVGLSPGGPAGSGWAPPVAAAAAIGAVLLGIAVAILAARRFGQRSGDWACGATLVVAVPLAAAAAGLPWPGVAAISLAGGLAALLIACRYDGPVERIVLAAAVGFLLSGPGVAGALPTPWSTAAALAAVVAVAGLAAATGRLRGTRIAAWHVAVGAAVLLALAAGAAVRLPVPWRALPVLGVAVAALALEALLRDRRRAEATALRWLAAGAFGAALLCTAGAAGRYAALVWALGGLALGARALRPADSAAHRRGYAWCGTAALVVAWWCLAADLAVPALEAYTVPAALAALGWGAWAVRGRPALSSWVAYGPGLAVGLVPAAMGVLAGDAPPPRRLLLGAAALAVLLWGVRGRRQAPVVLGGGVLALVALHELTVLWERVPSWIPLAVGGLLLVYVAVTLERRRRDVARLGAALRRMS